MNSAERDRIRRSVELLQKAAPRPTAELLPYERNQKDHSDAQVEQIAVSLRRFGWRQPIVVDGRGVIVIGHGRWLAARKLGLDTVPVVDAADLTADEIRELRIIDNKLNESPWNDFLAEDLQELTFDGFGDLFGEQNKETPESIDDIVEDDPPEAPEEPTAQLGQIWQLGDHRLLCGDATKRADIEKLLAGITAHLALTDPPYGISVVNVRGNDADPSKRGKVGNGGPTHFKKGKGKIGADHIWQASDYLPVKGDNSTDTARAYYEASSGLVNNQINFGGNYFTDFLSPSRCWVIWNKHNTGNFADAELAWTSFDKSVKLYDFTWNGLQREGERKVEGVHRVHPTQKPVGLMGMILRDFSSEGDAILDCFGGSGSTLIACEQLHRRCFMMEYEPAYCDVIIQRWEQFTGGKAVLLAE